MKTKFITLIIALLSILPIISAQVKVQLGQPYINIEDFSIIEFTAHPDYYELCSLDNTVIPVLIKNENKFLDTFKFSINKEYASLLVETTILKSGKSAILPLIISPPVGIEENTTLILDVITKNEAIKRSIKIKTNIKKCYLFDLKIDKDKDEICGCDKQTYNILLNNQGSYTDSFTLVLDIPEWINSTISNETIELSGGQKKEIKLEATPPCEEKGTFTIAVKAISEKTKAVLENKLELTVLPQKDCYNTIISADNVEIDYFGKNIPIKIENKGEKDATYSLTIEGIDWYTLSQTDFSLKQNSEKTINLALYPNENVLEGDYNIDIKAITDSQEFTESINIKLKSKGTTFNKVKFYVNFFRYYIGLTIILLIILSILIILLRKRIKKKIEKIKSKLEKKKFGEKKVIEKEVEEIKEKINWLPYIIYLIALLLLALFTYSTFKYRAYYEKALNTISSFFTNYIVPFGPYLRYPISGIGIILIIIVITGFFRKKPRKKRIQKIEKEKPKEEKKIEVKKLSPKIIEKKKLSVFEYIYLSLVIFLFLAIIAYAIYRFSDMSITLLNNFVKAYSLYFIIGAVILILLTAIITFIKKTSLKKAAKKIKRKTKNLIKNLVIIIIGLAILSGIIYSFVYYNLINYIKDFFIMYYPYILMGVGILIISILILHFHNKRIS